MEFNFVIFTSAANRLNSIYTSRSRVLGMPMRAAAVCQCQEGASRGKCLSDERHLFGRMLLVVSSVTQTMLCGSYKF